MKNKYLRVLRPISLVVLCFIVATGFIIEAQISKESTAKGDWSLPANVTKKYGWTLPAVISQTPNKVGVVDMEGVIVEKKVLSIEKRAVDFDNYYIRPNNEVRISPQKCVARAMTAFEAKGKRFAYQVVYNLVSDDYEKSGITFGAVYNIYFIDNDGDGNFEERIQQTDLPKLPQWVKEYQARIQ